jgi:hypothetical protein
MLTVVVVLNVLISLLCLYVAWQVWNLRRALAATTDAVLLAERNTYNLLHNAPQAISQGQVGVQGARESYQQLELQLQKVQQVLTLLSLVQRVWRSTPRSQSKRLRRTQRLRRRQKNVRL